MLSLEHSLGEGFHLYQHQVVKILENLANYPSNPWIGLISVKRIALCINPPKGGILTSCTNTQELVSLVAKM